MAPLPDRFRRHLRTIGHLATGFALGMKGLDKLEHGAAARPVGIFFLAAGLLVIAGTVLHHRLGVAALRFEAFLYAVESAASLILAWYFLHEGKIYLPTVMLVPAVAFAVMGVVLFRRSRLTAAPQPGA